MHANIDLCVCEPKCSFASGKSPGRGLYNRFMSTLIRRAKLFSQSGFAIVDPHQQHVRVPPALQPHQQLFKPQFLISAMGRINKRMY